MHWRLKANILATLSRIPLGVRAYQWLQRISGSTRSAPDNKVDLALRVVDLLRKHGPGIRDAVTMEIGTGWRPYMPYVMQLAGAKTTTTCDKNPWLWEDYAVEAYRALAPFLPRIAESVGIPLAEVQTRYDAGLRSTASMDELFATLGIVYVSPGDARQTSFADRSVDLVFSCYVLEHIDPQTLIEIHRETARILRPDGVAIHLFDPADHFSFKDKRITCSNFLRFSNDEWRWYGGSGLAYHNRLRFSEYRDNFAAGGLEIVFEETRSNAEVVAMIRAGKLPIAEQFRRFSPEELAGTYMAVVASPKRNSSVLKSDNLGAHAVQ